MFVGKLYSLTSLCVKKMYQKSVHAFLHLYYFLYIVDQRMRKKNKRNRKKKKERNVLTFGKKERSGAPKAE
ncbi:hypothetical protein PVC01_080024400 [Plasmodium vivax]|uniref:(malaria parasite P. vivax) hypothetical protein n=1 Tax=Plasmodium vivax TaxID=5855 RepID=A0A1G4GWE6_PLAVI|nr:unnamed protein product [Plasmodium vivax]CAI7720095.1 hypothetical protein PVPAM_080031700 [Plasmodium vivax]SCO66914.1 hypothetical protein PVT01_080024700 [Plasmodium vivax]SCO72340.1 hypothetical protein PVC01_080024400 [Plasmodium vivax]